MTTLVFVMNFDMNLIVESSRSGSLGTNG